MSIVTEGESLFIVDLEYLVPFDQIEPHLEAHMAFVRRGYDSGQFLMSGAKVPRSGGVILARGESRAAVEAQMAQDPFLAEGLCALKVTEFRATTLADALK